MVTSATIPNFAQTAMLALTAQRPSRHVSRRCRHTHMSIGVSSAPHGFDYPPAFVVEDIEKFAQQHGIYLFFNFVSEE
jgi:hypothetical protein